MLHPWVFDLAMLEQDYSYLHLQYQFFVDFFRHLVSIDDLFYKDYKSKDNSIHIYYPNEIFTQFSIDLLYRDFPIID